MGIGRRKDRGSGTGKRRSVEALNAFFNRNDTDGEEDDDGFPPAADKDEDDEQAPPADDTEASETIPFDLIVPVLDHTSNRRSKRIKRSNLNIIMAPEGPDYDLSSNESVNRNQLLSALAEAFVEVTEEMEDGACITHTDDAVIFDNFADRLHPAGMTETNTSVFDTEPGGWRDRILTDEELRLIYTPTVDAPVDYSKDRKTSSLENKCGIDNHTLKVVLQIFDLCNTTGIPRYFFDKLMGILKDASVNNIDLNCKAFTSFTANTF